jgi:hypothetical protein
MLATGFALGGIRTYDPRLSEQIGKHFAIGDSKKKAYTYTYTHTYVCMCACVCAEEGEVWEGGMLVLLYWSHKLGSRK